MNAIGLPQRKPAVAGLSAASVLAAVLWAAAVGVLLATRVAFDRVDAGALLVALVWAGLSTRLGTRIGLGRRHLVANLMGCTLLLGLYQLALLLAGR